MVGVAGFYTKGPTRVQFMDKDPKGWQEFYDQFAAQSAKGHALTMRGVQMSRPSIFDLEAAMEPLGSPDPDHDRRRGRSVPRARHLHEAQDPLVRPRGHPQGRSHHQPRGPGPLQPRRSSTSSPRWTPAAGRSATRSRRPDPPSCRPRRTRDDPAARALHRDRSHPRPLGPHLRAPARGHGRARGADLGARGRGGRLPAARLRLAEPPPQQALAHPRPQVAARHRDHPQTRQDIGCRRGELPARRQDAPRHRLRDPLAHQPAAGLRQHLRLRPGRPLSRPAGLRPDRPGHGRAHVDHRPARPGPGARGHPGGRSHRRDLPGPGHPGRAARARALRQGPVGAHLAAPGDGHHARLPGRALAHRP